MGHTISWIRQRAARHRALIGRLAFELIIVFVGVTAAFALENLRESREEAQYRSRMVAALRESLNDWAVHGGAVDRAMASKLTDFDVSVAKGKQVTPPIYRETGAERPTTRAWDGIVATGAARALDPVLFFRLARFYDRADSVGDRYLRYNQFTEVRVLPELRKGVGGFYEGEGARLRPEYASYVDRLRDLQFETDQLVNEAAQFRDELSKVK